MKIEERDHDKLPIDPILKCGIPRQNQVRIVHRTNSNDVGLKYKLLAVYDIESLWKFIEIVKINIITTNRIKTTFPIIRYLSGVKI